MTGRFITFEGIDGAGKSSHIEPLAGWLRERGHEVVITREPGGTSLAERLRELVLHEAMDPLTEALLVFAARRDHLQQRIEPALQRGATVLCDRFSDATFAYQGHGRGFALSTLKQLEQWVQQGRQPDLTLWFDLPPSVAAARRGAVRAPDRFEAQDDDFFTRVREGYAARQAADAARFTRIDAEASPQAVWQQVIAVLQARGWGVSGDGHLPWLQAPLAEALAQLRAHAILIHGASGVGQFDFALQLAQAWLCEEPTASGACGHCAGCHLWTARSHPDFFLLMSDAEREALGWQREGEGEGRSDAKSKARPSRDIKVEAVRQAIGWAQQTSSRGRGKVVLVHPAQAMNTVAANALLKTLEEPPAGVRLLLSTGDPDALLPTIRSRCQRWRLATPPREEALAWLEERRVPGAGVLLAAAGGRPLDAAAMSADGIDAERWAALPGAVKAGDARVLAGWPVPRVVDALQKLCHDAMATLSGGAPSYFPDGLPPGASLPALTAWAATLVRTARHDEHPWNAPLLVEALVVEGARCWPVVAKGRLATLGRR